MSEVDLPSGLPDWIKQHIELYLKDGAAAHLWDASFGKGAEPLTTLLLTTQGSMTKKDRTGAMVDYYEKANVDGIPELSYKEGQNMIKSYIADNFSVADDARASLWQIRSCAIDLPSHGQRWLLCDCFERWRA